MTFVLLIFVATTSLVAHFSLRPAKRDAGLFWARILDRLCLFVAAPLLVLSCLHTLAAVQRLLPGSSTWWLIVVGLIWLALLAIGVLRSEPLDSARWLAGMLGFSTSRTWVLMLAAPFLPAVFFLSPPWIDDILAAQWAVLWMFLAALLGVAFSSSPAGAITSGSVKEELASVSVEPWLEQMQARGIALRPLASWPATEAVAGTPLDEWKTRISAIGSKQVSGVLCRVVSGLVNAAYSRSERVATVLAPDDCGQQEVLALAAIELSRRFGETTLVITSAPDARLSQEIASYLKALNGETAAELLDLSDDATPKPGVQPVLIMTDAETLSNSLLDRIRKEMDANPLSDASGLVLGRIGLVVWWDAHEFTGVDAGHVWAVSRRLERLLNSRQGAPPRALVFARRPRERETPFLAFLSYLLPYRQSERNQHLIDSHFARPTHLYRLANHLHRDIGDAVKASSITGWPTTAPIGFSSAPGAPDLVPSSMAAGATILTIKAQQVLSLREMICQCGRSSPAGLEHHVAIATEDNPYVDFLLEHYVQHADQAASVNLVGADGHPELIQRHLLLGLREVPDTFTGLRANFRWEEQSLRKALDDLSGKGLLRRFPVRFLTSSGHLQRDSLYANQNPAQTSVRSFHIIGRGNERAVELRDLNVKDHLLFEVDPERLTIEAYPYRVFRKQGATYRVEKWSSGTTTDNPGNRPARIGCRPEEPGIDTWPFSTMRIQNLVQRADSLIFQGVQRYPATVQYLEDVNRILERGTDGTYKITGLPRVHSSFDTEALVLQFNQRFLPLNEKLSDEQLEAAAAILQCLVPVHTGIEDTALRVIPYRDKTRTCIAFVDLYPGGVGIVNAMHRDTALLPTLFDHAVLWIRSLTTPNSCKTVSDSPVFRTRNINMLKQIETLAVFVPAAAQIKVTANG